jgi:hypothetical protein
MKLNELLEKVEYLEEMALIGIKEKRFDPINKDGATKSVEECDKFYINNTEELLKISEFSYDLRNFVIQQDFIKGE